MIYTGIWRYLDEEGTKLLQSLGILDTNNKPIAGGNEEWVSLEQGASSKSFRGCQLHFLMIDSSDTGCLCTGTGSTFRLLSASESQLGSAKRR
jgi:hypothetical protein